MSTLIEPRVLKGFRDSLPEKEIFRTTLTEKLTKVFRSFGFVPIDTPALEYSEILLRKSNGETEKQVFRFTDNGKRDVALRFDLTVPFARFTAEHKNELYFPFKRYHIAKVWRGEKPQAGRYREFFQCDFDTIGSDSISSDFEILQVIHSSFLALGINDFKIHINDRAIFNQFLSHLGLQKNSEDILRTVDKLSKIGKDSVKNELSAITQSKDTAEKILSYITLEKDFSSTLQKITSLAGSETEDAKRMKSLYEMIKACNLENYFILDPSITRGLDYYTGIVYETFLENAKDIGSVCSGGRYNNLCGLYTKTSISGVGASIGLDRLIACLEKLNNTECVKSYINAEIFFTNEEHFLHYQKLANTLRKNGISVEVFPENKKMQTQYTLAERKGIKWGILVNDADIANNTFTLKNLLTREMFESISIEEGVSRILGK